MLIGKNTSTLHTEQLLQGVKNTSLVGKIMLSLAIHAVIIVVTSISFIGLCLKYGSLQPRPLHEAALAAEKTTAPQAPPPAVTAPAEPDVEAPVEAKSAIERELEDVSDERPSHSATGFDDIDSL